VKVFAPILLFGAERLQHVMETVSIGSDNNSHRSKEGPPWHALPIGMMESTCVNDY
jgi:hypothetical protein